MKVLLSVSENWARNYLVEIPDTADTTEKMEDEAIAAYLEWLNAGGMGEKVEQHGEPEYIDDGPSNTFFVLSVYDEEVG